MHKIFYLAALLAVCQQMAVFAQSEESESIIVQKGNVPFKAVAFSPDDKILAAGGDNKQILFWNSETHEYPKAITENCSVKSLAYTSENNMLVACGTEVRLISGTGKIIRSYGGYTTDVWSFGFNEKTRKITAGSYAKTVKIWDFATARLLNTLEGHEKSCLPVGISPSGDKIATGSLDKSIRIWDAESGKLLHKLEVHSGNIFAVTFHPSGKYIASASADKTIRLWDADSGRIVKTFTGHDAAIFDVQFSTDGLHMLSCDAGNIIILWETATGKKLYTFTGHHGAVNSVRFNHSGSAFASASDDGTVRYWNLDRKYFLAGTYFEKEIEKEVSQSALFAPKNDNESKQDYQARQLMALKYLDELYAKYYIKYLESLAKIPVE